MFSTMAVMPTNLIKIENNVFRNEVINDGSFYIKLDFNFFVSIQNNT